MLNVPSMGREPSKASPAPSRGRELNLLGDIDCPFHDDPIQMIKIQDADQTHIWLEQCPKCERLFFDAGEFTDKHRETLWDKVLGLLALPRPG